MSNEFNRIFLTETSDVEKSLPYELYYTRVFWSMHIHAPREPQSATSYLGGLHKLLVFPEVSSLEHIS